MRSQFSFDAGDDLAAARFEVLGHVLGHAADAHVGDGEPRAAAGLQEVVDLLARAEGHEERRDRAQVHHVRGDGDDVVHDPRELGEDHADRFRARGRGDAQELLHRQRPAVAVHEGRAVVQPVRVGDDLPVGPLLRHLLEVAVHVADLGLGVRDRLPVHERLNAEGAVHGGVGGADVDEELLRLRRHVQEPHLRLLQDVPLRGRVVLPHRVAHERVVGQEPAQVRVAVEDDPVEVPRLALEPVGAPEDAGEGVEPRLRFRARPSSAGRGASRRPSRDGARPRTARPGRAGRGSPLHTDRGRA